MFVITKECECRFEVEHGWTAVVSLTKGSAELFGCPLVAGESYDIGTGKYAIFSWYGAEVSITERADPTGASPTSPLATAYK